MNNESFKCAKCSKALTKGKDLLTWNNEVYSCKKCWPDISAWCSIVSVKDLN